MLMQIVETFEKSTSKSCHFIKNRIIVAKLTVSFKPKAKFICLGICQLHLESIQPITGTGFYKSSNMLSLKDNNPEIYKIFSKGNLVIRRAMIENGR